MTVPAPGRAPAPAVTLPPPSPCPPSPPAPCPSAAQVQAAIAGISGLVQLPFFFQINAGPRGRRRQPGLHRLRPGPDVRPGQGHRPGPGARPTCRSRRPPPTTPCAPPSPCTARPTPPSSSETLRTRSRRHDDADARPPGLSETRSIRLLESPTRTAARVVDATKVYGRNGNSVRALDGVDLEIGRGEFTAIMGPSGSGQVHPPPLPRRPRHPHLRTGLHRRHRPRLARRQAPHPPAPGPHRLRLPGLQPAPHPHRGREHHPAAGPGRQEGRTRSGSTASSTSSASGTASTTAPPSCPAASSSGWRRPGPS